MNENRELIQKEALELTLSHKRCGLGISMGVGKTRIAIQHLIKNYHDAINVLIVIPKNSVMESWYKELDKMELDDELKGLDDHITFSTYFK